jgi:hypothetical protein
LLREGTSGKTKKPLSWLVTLASGKVGKTYTNAIGMVIIASTMNSHLRVPVSRAQMVMLLARYQPPASESMCVVQIGVCSRLPRA